MARRTARKSRKRRRRSRRSRRRRGGGPGVAANASEVNFNEKPVDVADDAAPVEEAPAEAQEGGKRKRRRRKGRKSKRGGGCGLTEEQTGGKRRKTKKKKGGKRKLNAFFKAMLSAKKSKAKSFSYKGKTYVGKKHHRLGMIYSKKK